MPPNMPPEVPRLDDFGFLLVGGCNEISKDDSASGNVDVDVLTEHMSSCLDLV